MKWSNKKIRDVKWFSWWSIRSGKRENDESDDDEEIIVSNKNLKTPQKIQTTTLATKVPIKVKDMSSLLNSKDDNELSQIYYQTTAAMKNSTTLRPDSPNNRPDSPISRPDTPDNRPVTPYIEKSSTPFSRPLTPAMVRVMSESLPLPRSGTPFLSSMNDRTQCQSLTAKGVQCRNAAVKGFTKCRVHNY